MAFCKNCGAEMGDAKYCPKCGVAASKEVMVSPTSEGATTRTSGLSVASMVCGIVGLVIPFFGFVLGTLGIVFGAIALNQINKAPSLGGKGMATTGLVCGIVAIASWIIILTCVWTW